RGACSRACLDCASAAALDASGLMLIADPGANRIFRFNPNSRFLEVFAGNGTSGGSPDGTTALVASLRAPGGIAISSDGFVYFSEPTANLVRRIDSNAVITTVAGSGVAGFSGDGGGARQARLATP